VRRPGDDAIPHAAEPVYRGTRARSRSHGSSAATAVGFRSRSRNGDTDELLGAIDVRLGEIGSIGYWVGPWARNRGVATRALRLLGAWAIRDGGVRRLELITHPDNLASQRVAEKAGFVREGTRIHDPPFRDGRRENALFALTSGSINDSAASGGP
jgi:RimJ/RimL family protein N-acetyltransferase